MSNASETETGKAIPWWYVVVGIAVAFLLVFLLTIRGRQSSRPSAAASGLQQSPHDELFDYAIDSLNRTEDFDSDEMRRQAADRLNRWVEHQQPVANWRAEPMLTSLPEPLRELAVLDDLGALRFEMDEPHWDVRALEQAIWLRDLSAWARGDEAGEVSRAGTLFDWVVRNIQLDRQPPDQPGGAPQRMAQRPWETLIFGRGTAEERAWVFILLLRQEGIDAAMIGPAESEDSANQPDDAARLVGVLSGDAIYLFDPELGLPVPGPEGAKLDDDGRLAIEPATLADVVADDSLLCRLDADAEHPYPLRAEQLKEATVWVEASPSHLTQRMRLVELRLSGDDKLVLTTDPAAEGERFKQSAHVGQVRLWTLPYQVAREEERYPQARARWQFQTLLPYRLGVDKPAALWKGRSYHLKGKFEETPNAIEYYQAARPSNQQLESSPMDRTTLLLLIRAKLDASYWLGLVSAHQGNVLAAEDYWRNRSWIQLPDGTAAPWLYGCRYNLARLAEADDVAKAVTLYHGDKGSPAYHGNLLRAAWLESLTGVHVEVPDAKDAGENSGAAGPAEPARPAAEPAAEVPADEPAAPPSAEPTEPQNPQEEPPADG